MGVPVVDLPFKELLTHHIYELSPGTVLLLNTLCSGGC
jgi:hypothetical protein